MGVEYEADLRAHAVGWFPKMQYTITTASMILKRLVLLHGGETKVDIISDPSREPETNVEVGIDVRVCFADGNTI